MLELVNDPLIHLVRNAIDHGIEAPDARTAAGKPRRGTIQVTVAPSEGGRISIEVADDGRGFAFDALRDAAVRARLAPGVEQIAAMSDAAVAELAYSAGVSTSPVITTISGTRSRPWRSCANASSASTAAFRRAPYPEQGTVIRLEVSGQHPVTYRARCSCSCTAALLLPGDVVERVFGQRQDEVDAALARGSMAVGETTHPFGSLGPMLGLPRVAAAETAYGRTRSCVLLRGGDRQGVLLVDEVLGEHEVVIKDLRPPLLRVRYVLTTGLLGTGELVLVLRSGGDLLDLDPSPRHRTSPARR